MAARNPASGSSRQDPEATGEGREAQQAQQAQGSGQVEQYHPSERGGSARQESRADRQEDERALNARPQGQQSAQRQQGRQSQQSEQGQQSAQGQHSRQTQQSQAGRGTSAGTGVTSDRERQMQTSRETAGQRGVARQQSQVMSPEDQVSPFTFMRRFLEDTDQLFQAFGFGPTGFGTTGPGTLAPYSGRGSTAPARRSFWSPQLEISRKGNELVVCADLPGLEKNDINVNVEDGVLIIEGERRNESENDREGYYSTERSYGAFYRAIQLPEGVTGEQADATFKNGVLEIRLAIPQEQEQQGRRIEVK